MASVTVEMNVSQPTQALLGHGLVWLWSDSANRKSIPSNFMASESTGYLAAIGLPGSMTSTAFALSFHGLPAGSDVSNNDLSSNFETRGTITISASDGTSFEITNIGQYDTSDPYNFDLTASLATTARNLATHIQTLANKRISLTLDDNALRLFERVSGSYVQVTPYERINGSYVAITNIFERVGGSYVE